MEKAGPIKDLTFAFIAGKICDWYVKLLLAKYSGTFGNPTPEFPSSDKIYGPKVFLLLLTKIKPEYCVILYNLTHFPGSLVSHIRQVPLYE